MPATIGVSTAALFTHLQQFVFHAVPDTAQIYAHDEVVVRWVGVSGLRDGALHASIVERGVQATKGRNSLLDHRRDLHEVRDVATNADCFMAGGNQRFRSDARPGSVEVRQRDGRSRLREGLGCRQTHARGGTRDERNFVLK